MDGGKDWAGLGATGIVVVNDGAAPSVFIVHREQPWAVPKTPGNESHGWISGFYIVCNCDITIEMYWGGGPHLGDDCDNHCSGRITGLICGSR